MIGAYYQTQTLDPISGLGQVSAQASLAHEAVRELLGGTIGSFAPWGEQTVEGWRDISSPSHNYTLFPINAQTLQSAERQAVGNPVGLIGILYRGPMPQASVDEVFQRGPYELSRSEVIYRLDDQKPVPTPFFLYLGTLMDEGADDRVGSYAALEAAAKQTGGALVFMEPIARTGTERALPTEPLNIVIPAEAEERQVLLHTSAPMPASEPTPVTPPLDLGLVIAGVLMLGAGAVAGYHLLKK